MPEAKKKLIFVSHAPSDGEYAVAFAKLLESMGLHEDEIICSSAAPYSAPLRGNVYHWLMENGSDSELYIMYMLSHNYFRDADCLNEMGAAWVMKRTWMAFLMPGFDFDEIRGCLAGTRNAIKLDRPDQEALNILLDRLKGTLSPLFGLRTMSDPVWASRKAEFLARVASIADAGNKLEFARMVASSHGEIPQDPDAMTLDACIMVVYADSTPRRQISMSTDMTGITISSGAIRFNRDESFDEVTRWKAAIRRLEQFGYVDLINPREMIYEVTPRGHRFAEEARAHYDIDITKRPEEYLVED